MRSDFLVEFLSLVAIVVAAGAASVVLAVVGKGDAAVAGALLDIVKIGFGAIVALAYSARGIAPAPGSVTTTAMLPAHSRTTVDSAPDGKAP